MAIAWKVCGGHVGYVRANITSGFGWRAQGRCSDCGLISGRDGGACAARGS